MNFPVAFQPTPPNTAALLWRAITPASLLLTAAASLLGMASAAACGCGFDTGLAAVTLVLALTAHSVANLLGAHVELAPRTSGPKLTPEQAAAVRPWALSAGLVLLPAGVWLAAHSGGALLGAGTLGLLLVWAYLKPPLQLRQRPGGSEAVAWLVWFLLVLGADYVQRRQWFVIPASLGLSVGLLAACLPLVRGLLPGRPQALAQRLGQRMSMGLCAWLVLLAHGWLACSVFLLIPPQGALWGLTSLPLSLAAIGLLWSRANATQSRLRLAWWLSFAAVLVHTLALALVMAVAAGLR